MTKPFCPGSVYDQHRNERLQNDQLEPDRIYNFLMKLTGTNLEACCMPASLRDIRHVGGKLAITLSLKTVELQELAVNQGRVEDGLWTPALDDPFVITTTPLATFGVEGFFLLHDELYGPDEIVAAAELSRLLELANA